MPKYIDIHAHINFKIFEADHDIVIRRALDSGTWLFNIGTQIDTSRAAVKLAHKYEEGVYAVVGLHPIHTDKSFHDADEIGDEGGEFTSRGEVFNKFDYKELLEDRKVVALGECGLDYFHLEPESVKKQKEIFIAQIELANEVGKPLMIHVRNNYENKEVDAYADVLEILKEYAKVKGVIHFFESTLENAQKFIELGFYISFTGAITYPPKKNGTSCDYPNVIKNIPLDMILTDTDSPYVAPIPYRGQRNEPSYVKEIVKKIAEIRNMPEEEVAKAVVSNVRKLFRI